MSELRQNPLTKEWVIVAENRNDRPYDFIKNTKHKEKDATYCPFCRGNELQTPVSIFQNGKDNNWTIRMFPNRFPAVSLGAEKYSLENFYNNEEGIGMHDVLVDTDNHKETINTFSLSHLKDILDVLQKRFIEIKEHEKIAYVQIFKNCGVDAGMSINHSHWQIMGLPIVSRREMSYELSAKEYMEKNNRCIFCDMIAHEKESKDRYIEENDEFISFTPYASKFSYELWIAPKKHISSYSDFTCKEIENLAHILKSSIEKTSKIREDISFNICFMDSPKMENSGVFHWYIQILPRIGGFAGFEFATDTFINSLSPEKAAKFYREI